VAAVHFNLVVAAAGRYPTDIVFAVFGHPARTDRGKGGSTVKRRHLQRAFSIIELMIVIAILTILAAILLP
jgi:prepilin-type N-terminal cleavage/methylation domain-containing protein